MEASLGKLYIIRDQRSLKASKRKYQEKEMGKHFFASWKHAHNCEGKIQNDTFMDMKDLCC